MCECITYSNLLQNGMTGLMHACVNKHTQCVSSLLELDAHVDLQDQVCIQFIGMYVIVQVSYSWTVTNS